MGVSEAEFYDTSRVAIVPMGFCFPGLDAKGGDRPPRKECAPLWRDRVFAELPRLELILLVGQHAQRWHLDGEANGLRLTETVARWRAIMDAGQTPRLWPLPHPSWRNNAWFRRHPWFEAELLPELRRTCRGLLDTGIVC
jgi:uracil-DNA glycosylase